MCRLNKFEQIYSKNSVSVFSEVGQNSFRLNVIFNKRDQLEKTICSMYAKFIQKRADSIKIFRRRPALVEGGQDVDLSMLITKRTLGEYKGESIAQFTANFAQDFEKERTAMKLYINSKARSVASAFLDEFK